MFNFAFIGCGLMAHWDVQELLRSGHVRADAAVDPLRSHADAQTYPTLEALLAAPPAQLDGVVIVTPHTVHAPLALARCKRTIRAADGWISQDWLAMTRNTWRQVPARSGGFAYNYGVLLSAPMAAVDAFAKAGTIFKVESVPDAL